MRPDELERRLRQRLDALGPAPRAELLRVLMRPDFDRADAIGSYWGNPETRTFGELLIDCEEDRTLRAVLVGMLRGGSRGPMIGFRITPGIATIIGAAAAIAGGLGAAYYQSRQTRRRAIQLRAQEREEAGLLRLGAMVAEIRPPMETYLWLDNQGHVRENPQPAAEAEQLRNRLLNLWEGELAWRIRDEAIGRGVADLLNKLGEVRSGGKATRVELQRAVDSCDALGKAIRGVLNRE